MKTKVIAFILISLMTQMLWAQPQNAPAPKPTRAPETRQERRERMREKMREEVQESRRILQQFMQDDMFSGLRQQFEQMFQQMEHGQLDDFQQFFNDEDIIKRLFKGGNGASPFNSIGRGQSRWLETPNERILVLKLEVAKDTPIDFKIESSRLDIEGFYEKRTPQGIAKQSFKRSYEIPSDCDPSQAKFENKDGEVLIKFPKLKIKDQRKPLTPDKSDSTI